MDRKDYISDNLRDISKELKDVSQNGLKLPVYNPDDEEVFEEENVEVSTISNYLNKAQERRLSDIYKAKLDLAARITKTIVTLNEFDVAEKNRVELRTKILLEMQNKLNSINKLHEPENGKELLTYIREVEHLRMDFFTYEAQVNNDINSSNVVPFGTTNSVDVKYFYKLAKYLVILLIILIVAVIAASIVIAVTIWLSMKV